MPSIETYLNSAGSLIAGNWQHATRLFIDDNYRLSPRTKFLYYVYFDINEKALKSTSWNKQTHGRELGMLVKRSALPKFSIESITKNQYNRKKILYKTLKYEPIQLSFHDDSNSVVTSMWALYYGYYVVDRNLQPSDYQYNQYDADLSQRYGLDNNVGSSGEKHPFFNSIQVFTMSRQRFVGYTLLNPRITNWSHGDVDYEDGTTVESSMSVEYENVLYSSGTVTQGTPKGFAELHYDYTSSPLTTAGGDATSASGPSEIYGKKESPPAWERPQSTSSTVTQMSEAIRNAQNLSSPDVNTSNTIAPSTDKATMGSLGGVFPKTGEETTEASPKSTSANVRDLQAAEAAAAANTRSTQAASLAAAEKTIPPANNDSLYPDDDDWLHNDDWLIDELNQYDEEHFGGMTPEEEKYAIMEMNANDLEAGDLTGADDMEKHVSNSPEVKAKIAELRAEVAAYKAKRAAENSPNIP